MATQQLEKALQNLYDQPTATDLKLFDDIRNTLFISSRSSQSRVEVYQRPRVPELCSSAPQPSVDTANNPSASEQSEVRNNEPLAPDLVTDWVISRLENEEQIRQYASTNNFQVYFVRQRNSYSPLSISSDLFETLCQVCEAPWDFRNYFLYFGDRESEVEIAPPPLRHRSGGKKQAATGKSNTATTTTYCVRFVDTNNRTDVSEPSARWSLRQTSVFCKFDPLRSKTSCIFINLSQSTQLRLRSLWANVDLPEHIQPLHFHYVVYSIAVANWRPYAVALHDEIEQHAEHLLGSSPDNKGPLEMSDSGERTSLLILESKILTAQLAISATQADLISLHHILVDSVTTEINGTREEMMKMMEGLSRQLRELEVSVLRFRQLHTRLQSITNLVSSFLDLSNGFALQELAMESRRESEEMLKLNEKMHGLAEKNTHDAAAVTVLTILTLIYLPITVVSNFFSTSFVGTATSAKTIFVTEDWWILAATSIPLTLFTLYVWWVWTQIKAYEKYPWWWQVGRFMFKSSSS